MEYAENGGPDARPCGTGWNVSPRWPARLGAAAWVASLLLLAGLVLLPTPARAEVTAAQVETAIRRGVDYLKEKQLASGGWEEIPRHPCGLSALCMLAMATAGVPAEEPVIAKGLSYLRKSRPQDTYSLSLQTLAMCQIGAGVDLPLIRENVQLLLQAQINNGAWTYQSGTPSSGDPSNTQFALLALAAAEERGVAIPPAVYDQSLQYWLSLQDPSGGWGYSGELNLTGSMTCAGVASLIICRGRLADFRGRVREGQISCCGGNPEDEQIARGLRWLGDHFSARANPGATGIARNTFYYLYALERVGRMSGQRLIGDRDWYREGAEFLVGNQDRLKGFWASGGAIENNRLVATSFALLFLAKGKRQVALAQVEYGTPPMPLEHRQGPQQLVRFLERDWGRDLTWQTVQLGSATLEDLLQAPVLLISGKEAPAIDEKQRQRLKEYVDQGGFIIFEANAGPGCGTAEAFEQWVQAFARQLLGSPLERLPPDHPIWFAHRKLDGSVLGENFWIYGVQACCRTAVVYLPMSLSCRWELSDPTGRRPPPEPVRSEIEGAITVGENLVAYATGRELKEKLELRSVLTEEPTVASQARDLLTIGRLGIDAGGLEARRALPNLARYLDQFTPMRVATESPQVALDRESLSSYAVLWLSGRRAFELTEPQRTALREYLENGGMLLADSICGDEAFTASFREEMRKILPASPLVRIGSDHPLLSASLGGFDLSSVTVRSGRQADGGGVVIEKRRTGAILETASLDDRVVVIFSPLDLSCALESQSSIQCPGYTTEDAARLGINMVIFTLLQ